MRDCGKHSQAESRAAHLRMIWRCRYGGMSSSAVQVEGLNRVHFSSPCEIMAYSKVLLSAVSPTHRKWQVALAANQSSVTLNCGCHIVRYSENYLTSMASVACIGVDSLVRTHQHQNV